MLVRSIIEAFDGAHPTEILNAITGELEIAPVMVVVDPSSTWSWPMLKWPHGPAGAIPVTHRARLVKRAAEAETELGRPPSAAELVSAMNGSRRGKACPIMRSVAT